MTGYEEVVVTDSDGNTVTKPGTVGLDCKAVVQPVSSSEGDDGTAQKFRMRLIGWAAGQLGVQSSMEWNGKRYAIDGDPLVFNSSRRTAHVEYRLFRK